MTVDQLTDVDPFSVRVSVRRGPDYSGPRLQVFGACPRDLDQGVAVGFVHRLRGSDGDSFWSVASPRFESGHI